MEGKDGTHREIAVPVSVFRLLRRELTQEAGALPTIHALHHAGYESGAEAAKGFAQTGGGMASMAEGAFWGRLSKHFARRGFGTLTQATGHPGVGTLQSHDWAESDPEQVDPDGSCFFSTGFLSGFLTELAGGPVAVLEVDCRTRGDDACRFAFGSETAIHDLYGRLVEGADLDGALSAL